MHKKRGYILIEPNKLKQTLTTLHKGCKMYIVSAESYYGKIKITIDWSEFQSVNMKKPENPPIYKHEFFAERGFEI